MFETYSKFKNVQLLPKQLKRKKNKPYISI